MFEKIEKQSVSKKAITRLFKIAIWCVVAGAVGGAVVVIAALTTGAVSFGGPQIVSVDPGPFAGAVIGLIVASTLTGVGTAFAVASWLAALLNTARLPDKTWFGALLALGLVSLGWLAMIAYVLRGPDSSSAGALAEASSGAAAPSVA